MGKRFSVYTDCLHQARHGLRRCYMRLNANMEELDTLRRRLADTTGMEACMKRLAEVNAELEEKLLALGQMNRALERAEECYRGAERRLVQAAEEGTPAFIQRDFGWNDLQPLWKELERYALF